MRWRSWVIITPPKRDDPIYPSKAPYGSSAAERLRSTPDCNSYDSLSEDVGQISCDCSPNGQGYLTALFLAAKPRPNRCDHEECRASCHRATNGRTEFARR